MTSPTRRYTTKEAAQQVGVSKDTILSWLAKGRIPEPQRDWRNWRVWTDADIRRAIEWNSQMQPAIPRPSSTDGAEVDEVSHT